MTTINQPSTATVNPSATTTPAQGRTPEPLDFERWSSAPTRRRKPRGKIAELPKSQRDLINNLLDDGATYKTIRAEMATHGVKLNAENVSNWFESGYQDHL